MPTTHPRLNVTLERPLYRSLSRLARKEGLSLSLKARDLIKEALELKEDIYWLEKATSRARTFTTKAALSHSEVWSKK